MKEKIPKQQALRDPAIEALIADPTTKFLGTLNVTVEVSGDEARELFKKYWVKYKREDRKTTKKWILCNTKIAIYFSEMCFFTITPGRNH